MRVQAESLERMIAEGTVVPQIGARYSFADLPKALEHLEQGKIRGKAVVQVS